MQRIRLEIDELRIAGGFAPCCEGTMLGSPQSSLPMTARESSRTIVSFGPFEADLQTQELKKSGVRLRLPGQSFQILSMLLQRPGELVSREELRQALWPAETFVDFEKGINAAITRLREALGDSAENPRYVETLPRRGYRFIGMLNRDRTVQVTTDRGERSSELLLAATAGDAAPDERGARQGALRRMQSAWLVIATLIVVFGVALFWWRQPSPVPKLLGYRQLTKDAQPKILPYGPSTGLFTNGARIYYFQGPANQIRAVAEVSSTGGDPVSITTPFDWPALTGISPDGSQLLANSGMFNVLDRPVWIIAVPSGTARRLGSVVGHDAAWSPDGRTVAFGKEHDLYLTDIDASTQRKLVSLGDSFASNIRWSVDEKVLRFTRSDEASSSLWQVSSDGTGLRQLVPNWSGNHPQECCGNWTADGRYFVFQATRGGVKSIFAIREQPIFRKVLAQPAPLTSGPLNFLAPAPSKNGNQIFAIGEHVRGELTRINATGQLVRYLSGISAEHLDFSKDLQWVTYITYPEAMLWRSRLDGSERLQLTMPPMEAVSPRWSPDSRQIVFAGLLPGGKYSLYVIPADGGKPSAVTDSKRVEVDPTWSPDGTALVFGEVPGWRQPIQIHMVDLAKRRVSDLPGSEGLFSPRWSPNGRHVVAMASDFKTLMLFDFTTQTWSELTKSRLAGWPSWSRDGKHVHYFDSFEPAYYRIRIADRRTERLASLEQIRNMYAGRFWNWLGVAPDGAPLFLRNTSVQEIYALDVDLP
jgi:Tol biopolymer transport system component/DNA-binding winged helix-turn-helix (wHTH) protein